MRRSRFLQAGILSFCLIVGYMMLGCGDEEQIVTIEVEQLCALALEAMNSPGCRDSAYADIEDFTVCFRVWGDNTSRMKECLCSRVCGDDTSCMEKCTGEQDVGFGDCYGNLELLVSGQCGNCYIDCFLDLLGEESGCLYNPGDPEDIGTACLDDLYTCVNRC